MRERPLIAPRCPLVPMLLVRAVNGHPIGLLSAATTPNTLLLHLEKGASILLQLLSQPRSVQEQACGPQVQKWTSSTSTTKLLRDAKGSSAPQTVWISNQPTSKPKTNKQFCWQQWHFAHWPSPDCPPSGKIIVIIMTAKVLAAAPMDV